jgi:hypothetical protein
LNIGSQKLNNINFIYTNNEKQLLERLFYKTALLYLPWSYALVELPRALKYWRAYNNKQKTWEKK